MSPLRKRQDIGHSTSQYSQSFIPKLLVYGTSLLLQKLCHWHNLNLNCYSVRLLCFVQAKNVGMVVCIYWRHTYFRVDVIGIYILKILFSNLFKSLQSVYTISYNLMNRAIINLNFYNQATRSIIVRKLLNMNKEGNTLQFCNFFSPHNSPIH